VVGEVGLVLQGRSESEKFSFHAEESALTPEKKHDAIWCDSSCGPCFRDIGVSDNCNARTDCFTRSFGRSYANDTGLAGEAFFTGSTHFAVREIEVFEITD
jgi:hypothetical protein